MHNTDGQEKLETIRVSLFQTDIIWENKSANLISLYEELKKLSGLTDIVILPEMFSTGFSMNSHTLAEPITGNTISLLQQWALTFQLAIAGSYIAVDGTECSSQEQKFYNRGFFITPEKKAFYYDKRHLFRMGSEPDSFDAGNQRTLISYRGWNICLLVCYDLRFPVWSRNANNEYDLLIYVANWPESRRQVWDVLLQARALENMSYVCGVNRIGKDGNYIQYNGGSVLYSSKGELLYKCVDNKEEVSTIKIDLSSLRQFRKKFPAWKDADHFTID